MQGSITDTPFPCSGFRPWRAPCPSRAFLPFTAFRLAALRWVPGFHGLPVRRLPDLCPLSTLGSLPLGGFHPFAGFLLFVGFLPSRARCPPRASCPSRLPALRELAALAGSLLFAGSLPSAFLPFDSRGLSALRGFAATSRASCPSWTPCSSRASCLSQALKSLSSGLLLVVKFSSPFRAVCSLFSNSLTFSSNLLLMLVWFESN